jgi:hypothetical protein
VNPNGTTTTLIAGLTNGQNPELSYSYDALGNITEVYKGSALQARYTYDVDKSKSTYIQLKLY